MVGYHIRKITTLTPQFTFTSNLLWIKINLYIEHFDTIDADLSFILVSNVCVRAHTRVCVYVCARLYIYMWYVVCGGVVPIVPS